MKTKKDIFYAIIAFFGFLAAFFLWKALSESSLLYTFSFAVVLSLGAFIAFGYYEASFVESKKEYRVSKLSCIFETQEVDIKYKVQELMYDHLIKKEYWTDLTTSTRLEEANQIMENLKKGIPFRTGYKIEPLPQQNETRTK